MQGFTNITDGAWPLLSGGTYVTFIYTIYEGKVNVQFLSSENDFFQWHNAVSIQSPETN